jgi:hypothetical protein
MRTILTLLVIAALWYVLSRFVLPRLGIRT